MQSNQFGDISYHVRNQTYLRLIISLPLNISTSGFLINDLHFVRIVATYFGILLQLQHFNFDMAPV